MRREERKRGTFLYLLVFHPSTRTERSETKKKRDRGDFISAAIKNPQMTSHQEEEKEKKKSSFPLRSRKEAGG